MAASGRSHRHYSLSNRQPNCGLLSFCYCSHKQTYAPTDDDPVNSQTPQNRLKVRHIAAPARTPPFPPPAPARVRPYSKPGDG